MTQEQRLLYRLMTGYDRASRPVYDATKPVNVKVGISLTQILDVVSFSPFFFVFLTCLFTQLDLYDDTFPVVCYVCFIFCCMNLPKINIKNTYAMKAQKWLCYTGNHWNVKPYLTKSMLQINYGSRPNVRYFLSKISVTLPSFSYLISKEICLCYTLYK